MSKIQIVLIPLQWIIANVMVFVLENVFVKKVNQNVILYAFVTKIYARIFIKFQINIFLFKFFNAINYLIQKIILEYLKPKFTQ